MVSTISVRIPPEKIEEVRNATDIVDLVGGFVKLKKRGKNYLGLCPFHTEKTPSFSVSPDRQMYHCFGCGVGGNAITFVMEYEKVSFVEGVRSLAEKAGINLPQYSSGQEEQASEQEQLYEACREAGLFFYKSLTETGEAKYALDYFHTRGFSDETIRTFGLGYSPNSWDAFLRHATEKVIATELLEKAGLVRRRDDGTYYDYFRGRAMFPIFSPTGRVVGFGARKLREDDPLGKYINSPETLIYNKSKVLYGIFQSKEAIRENDFVILVEGYADLISVFQAGIKNIVASSGTALTAEQIQLVGRFTKNITIVYDADSAGSKAALRGVDLILENDLDVRVAALPEGDDPDSFVKKHGGDAFRKLLDDAVSFVDFIAQAYEREGSMKTPEGQSKTVRVIVGTIAKMKDELKRNFYIKHVGEKYGLYESTLYREMEKTLGNRRYERAQQRQPVAPTYEEMMSSVSTRSSVQVPQVERDLILAMLEGGKKVVDLIFTQVQLEAFSHPNAKEIVTFIMQAVEDGENLDPSAMVNAITDPEERNTLADIVFSKYQLSRGWDESKVQIEQADPVKIAADALIHLRRRTLEKMVEDNQRILKAASHRGENVTPLLERHQQLVAEIRDLETAKK